MTLEEESNFTAVRATSVPGAERRLSKYAAIRIIEDGSGSASAVVTGELDLSCVGDLTSALRDAVNAHPAGLRVDLSGVTFCGCCTLRSLLSARALADALGRDFVLGSISRAVARLMELTGTYTLLTTQCGPTWREQSQEGPSPDSRP